MKRPPLGHALSHPVALAAVVVLLLNDHVLKAKYPGFITGKLSDFAGMIVAPLFVVAIIDALVPASWLRKNAYRAIPWLAALVVGCGFAAAKTWRPATVAYECAMAVLWRGRGRVVLVRDLGDLAALPMGALAAFVARRHPERSSRHIESAPRPRAVCRRASGD